MLPLPFAKNSQPFIILKLIQRINCYCHDEYVKTNRRLSGRFSFRSRQLVVACRSDPEVDLFSRRCQRHQQGHSQAEEG